MTHFSNMSVQNILIHYLNRDVVTIIQDYLYGDQDYYVSLMTQCVQGLKQEDKTAQGLLLRLNDQKNDPFNETLCYLMNRISIIDTSGTGHKLFMWNYQKVYPVKPLKSLDDLPTMSVTVKLGLLKLRRRLLQYFNVYPELKWCDTDAVRPHHMLHLNGIFGISPYIFVHHGNKLILKDIRCLLNYIDNPQKKIRMYIPALYSLRHVFDRLDDFPDGFTQQNLRYVQKEMKNYLKSNRGINRLAGYVGY